MKTKSFVVYSKSQYGNYFSVFRFNQTKGDALKLVEILTKTDKFQYFIQPQLYGKDYGESLPPCPEIHEKLYPNT